MALIMLWSIQTWYDFCDIDEGEHLQAQEQLEVVTVVQGLLQVPQSWVPLFKRCLLYQQVEYSLVALEWQWIQPKEILILIILEPAMHYLELHSFSWELAHIQPAWHVKIQSWHLLENIRYIYQGPSYTLLSGIHKTLTLCACTRAQL